MITPEVLITAARQYLRTPFHHQGRLKGVGVDCVGLIVCACRDCGIALPDRTDYPAQPDGVMLRTLLGQCLLERQVTEPGMVGLFSHKFVPTHVGLFTDHGVIHADASHKMVVEHVFDRTWQRRCVSAYQIPGVASWQF